MNKYTDKQVGRMAINPYVEGDITKTYPQLLSLLQNKGTAAATLDKYFRYLSFVWDRNSPMVIEFPDLDARRRAAKVESNYDGKKAIDLEIPFICNIVRSRLWTLICCYERTFQEFAERVSDPISVLEVKAAQQDELVLKATERKDKLLRFMDDYETALPTLYKRLFEGDKELEDTVALTDMRPESIAKMNKNR